MTTLKLSDYDMSAERGFLCRHTPADVKLTGGLAKAREVAMDLPALLQAGNVRTHLMDGLPDLSCESFAGLSDAEARMAMVHYAFMVQAYMWGEPGTPTVLPKNLAVPMVALSKHLGQPPIMSYSVYVLDNWGKLDKAGPIGLDNLYLVQKFLSGQDESWFILVHVAIEARAGACLALMGDIVDAANQEDIEKTRSLLEETAQVWVDLRPLFNRMPERCDPHIYFQNIRPYLHGWKDNPELPNGLIYEGVEEFGNKPQYFRGQTGSQSSIVPAMDALMGVGHAADPLKAYLDQLHIYRPPAHRRFIDDLRAKSKLRAFVTKSGNKALAEAYNANVQAVSDFRSLHLEYAAKYISNQSSKQKRNDPNIGTGGTPFMKYLKKHRDETQANLVSV